MKKIVFGMSLILVFAFAFNAYALEVAYVDIEKVFNKYEGTKKAKESLQKEIKKEQKSIEKETEKLKEMQREIERKSSILSPKKLQKMELELQTKKEKLSAKALEIQRKLLSEEKEMMSDIMGEIRAIVKNIARDKNYDYVFSKETLFYGGDDITYDVIKEMNE